MRVVIDTGVFISAAIKAQTAPNIAVYRAARRGVLLKSHSTEAELMEVIDRPYLARLIAPAARAQLAEFDGDGRIGCPSPGASRCVAIPRMTSFSNWR